jgi:hypothetical protein
MISVEKPGTPSELVHHGVKGQKWGVRRRVLGAANTRTGKIGLAGVGGLLTAYGLHKGGVFSSRQALALGTAATVAMLQKQGEVNLSAIRKKS